MRQIIDISNWNYDDIAVSGSKEKRWFRIPETNQLVLFKLPVSLTSDTWTTIDEISGEMWSEKISSEIGTVIDFNVHRVDIGAICVNPSTIDYYGINPAKITSDKIYGALCYSILDERDESLIEGADMIMEFDPTYDRNLLRGQSEIYNLHSRRIITCFS